MIIIANKKTSMHRASNRNNTQPNKSEQHFESNMQREQCGDGDEYENDKDELQPYWKQREEKKRQNEPAQFSVAFQEWHK